jgi:hypothetical protein
MNFLRLSKIAQPKNQTRILSKPRFRVFSSLQTQENDLIGPTKEKIEFGESSMTIFKSKSDPYD